MLDVLADYRTASAILGGFFVVIAYVPYLRDIFKGKTTPHLYTWLIWFLTLSTALAGMWSGGAYQIGRAHV